MIVREFHRTRKDGVNLYKTYSSEGYLIQKVGTEEIYKMAIDVETAPYVYVETDKKPKEKRKGKAEELQEEVTDELGGL